MRSPTLWRRQTHFRRDIATQQASSAARRTAACQCCEGLLYTLNRRNFTVEGMSLSGSASCATAGPTKERDLFRIIARKHVGRLFILYVLWAPRKIAQLYYWQTAESATTATTLADHVDNCNITFSSNHSLQRAVYKMKNIKFFLLAFHHWFTNSWLKDLSPSSR